MQSTSTPKTDTLLNPLEHFPFSTNIKDEKQVKLKGNKGIKHQARKGTQTNSPWRLKTTTTVFPRIVYAITIHLEHRVTANNRQGRVQLRSTMQLERPRPYT